MKAGAAMLWARLRGKRDQGPAILRRTFEDLGPTYVKLGQLVASSQGLFPEAYCTEYPLRLIAEAVGAMEAEATVETMMHTIHAHPTLTEVLGEGFNAVYGLAINA